MNISCKKPLYYQLKQAILKWIEDGEYLPGALIPSEKQLQELFHISRTTVRLALKELEQEGFLVRSPGKGTYVSCMKMESGPRRLLSFTQEMINFGLRPGSQIISIEKERPAGRTAKLLEIAENQLVWRLERIRLADAVPVVTEINCIPVSLVQELDVNILKNQSFYEYLEREYGIVIAYARERVECRLANMRESKHLDVPKGAPLLYIERLTYGYRKSRPMEQIPVELVKMSYNAEKYAFHQVIRKE